MRHDLFNWKEFKANEKVTVGRGKVHVRTSRESALFAQAEGVESLVGVGTEFQFALGEAAALTLDGPPDVRWFVLGAVPTAADAAGEVFTNIDRMVQESGSVVAVKQALRELELRRREVLREIRRERDEAQKERERARQQEPERQAAMPEAREPEADA